MLSLLLAATLQSPAPANAGGCALPPVPAKIVAAKMPNTTAHLDRPNALVSAKVNAAGHVIDATVVEGTGDKDFDAATIAAMRKWTFVPAKAECSSAAGSVAFIVGFDGDQVFADPRSHPAIAMDAVPPDFPDDARGVQGTVEVDVSVTLDAHGRFTEARTVNSSRNVSLDRSALLAARLSSYFPAVKDGIPEPSTYLFKAVFDSNH